MDAVDLKNIRSFPQLVKYLRDELDWPIESDDFDDLTFEYTAEELGIDSKTAAKIQEVKQLRPLNASQPWGIFFVKFEPRHLPVVALRRILSRLVLRKRQSANAAERKGWEKHDLLFISSFGEGEDRQISFAHFTGNDHHGDLPTLKVLGWDQEDTVRKLDHVHTELKDKLRWPGDPADVNAWRDRWAGAFSLRHREVITKSKDLAVRLAELARDIRKRVNAALKVENDKGPLTTLMIAFKQALIHDLNPDDFADMYAQTIAYGLLTARVSRPAGIVADNLADMVPITNPFLKELMVTFLNLGGRKRNAQSGKLTGIDFDELGVNDVVDLLRETNMEAVLRDFDNRNPLEDPVIHFYEHFLKEYDSQKRMQRGVFYTPKPVVSYIVRSVHELLQTEFGLEDGLADTTTWGQMLEKHKDLKLPTITITKPGTTQQVQQPINPTTPFVQILDPATGTATFLVEVIDLIHKTMLAKWKKQGRLPLEIPKLWNEYVPNHLLPRLHGYELMMAPYAIAHMKIGLKLFETGYQFGSGQRARIYLTNALEPAQDFSETFEQMAPALAHEANAVNDVKRHRRFTVVIGNPPYSKASQNLGDQFASLIERYRYFHRERIREPGAILFERDINNDYCKFLGFDRNTIDLTGIGIVGVITSSSYLDGKNFRGVRDALAESHSRIGIFNLHGDSRSGAHAREGTIDENVFEIETGVSVFIGARCKDHQPCTMIGYTEITGTYEGKCAALIGERQCDERQVPLDARRYDSYTPSISTVFDEYSTYPRFDHCFNLSVDGIKTSRDGLVISDTASAVASKIRKFTDFSGGPEDIEAEFNISVSNWDYKQAQKHLTRNFSEQHIHRIAYRPFDFRYIYYDPKLVFSHRYDKMIHMVRGANIGLVCASRLSAKGFDHVLPTDCLVEMKYASHDTNSRLFPFFQYRDLSLLDGREPNAVSEVVSRCFVSGDLGWPEAAEAVYAVLNCATYRERYRDEIKNDFPSIPVQFIPHAWQAFSALGRELIEVQLLRRPAPTDAYPFVGRLQGAITVPRWEGKKLYLTNEGYFDRVEQTLFEFRIGGYHVCKSWVSAGNKSGIQRKGQQLTAERAEEFRKVLHAMTETTRIRQEIDMIIEKHGGWPAVFITDPAKLAELKGTPGPKA